jgi:hypothetical protein
VFEFFADKFENLSNQGYKSHFLSFALLSLSYVFYYTLSAIVVKVLETIARIWVIVAIVSIVIVPDGIKVVTPFRHIFGSWLIRRCGELVEEVRKTVHV